MNNPPILYGKNTVTGAITQITTVGNVLLYNDGSLNDLNDVVITSATTGQSLAYNGTNWTNQNKDYITINMYGTTVAGVYSTTTEKYPMVCSSTYWGSIPNPNIGTQGSVASGRSNVYTTGTGVITLDTNRKYIITASINIGGLNLNAVTNAELRLKNWVSGTTFTNFSPDYFNNGVLAVDFTGFSLQTVGFVSNSPGFTITFRFLTAQGVSQAGWDTSITITAMEI